MKHVFAVLSVLALMALGGCAETPDQLVRKMRLEQRTVLHESRLFSTVGFWVLDEPVRKKAMASFEPGGALNRAMLRSEFSDATLTEEGNNVMVMVGSGTVPTFVLSDGPLIALDSGHDEMVRRLAQDYAHDGKPVPVIGK